MAEGAPAGPVARLGRELASKTICLVLATVAAAIALVAIAFAAYAGLKIVTAPSLAAALIALAFAVIAALLALVVPKMVAPKPAPPRRGGLALEPSTVRAGLEIAVLALGVFADPAARRTKKTRR